MLKKNEVNPKKIWKVIKGLINFTFDDLLIMSGAESQEILDYLDRLIKSRHIIKKSEDEYVLINSTNPDQKIEELKFEFEKNRKKSKKSDSANPSLKKQFKLHEVSPSVFNPEKIIELFDEEKEKEDLQKYLAAPEWARQKVDRYLAVINESNGLTGKRLKYFVKKWNEKYPDISIGVTTLYRIRLLVKRFGKAALIPNYGQGKGKSCVGNELYSKFRELYLSYKRRPLKECLEILKKDYFLENPEAEEWRFPSSSSFLRRLKNEFSPEEINYYRSEKMFKQEFKTPKQLKTEEKKPLPVKKGDFEYFNDAAMDFLSSEYCKKLRKSAFLSYKSIINSHLIPFFKEMKLSEISEEILEEFKQQKIEEGFSASAIEHYTDLLKILIKEYCPENQELLAVKSVVTNELRILEPEEIKRILNAARDIYPEIYPILFTAISTGMSKGELLALKWKDVDLTQKTFSISNSLYKGKVSKLRSLRAIRTIKVNDEVIKLLENIEKNENSFVFTLNIPDIKERETALRKKFVSLSHKTKILNLKFGDIRDTYAAMALRKNVPVTFLQNQLGLATANAVAERYGNLMPQVEEVNILENL